VPSEAEIRAMVERILDGMEKTEVETPSSPDVAPRQIRVAVGADHGGFRLKEYLAFRLKERGLEVTDCGTHSEESVDYPDFALAVAEHVADGRCDAGIVVDGAGIGSAMVANKVPGVRAALCYDISSARNSREHNHANVLTLGAGLIGQSLAWQIVEAWLDTPWGPGRHARRVAMIDAIDDTYRRTTS
jgi:RpiB/LacA/LacB family sugar-phosphate isomerase